MSIENSMVNYYADRASEYERIYHDSVIYDLRLPGRSFRLPGVI
jgi:hypothetical protein